MKKNQWEIIFDATEGKVVCIQSNGFVVDDARPVYFRCKDDDGEVYYYGKMQRVDFDPLDDFAAPNAGCTTIEYLHDGEWTII
jgi:hypothetical protein